MKREKPAIILKRTARGVVPLSAYDEEQLAAIPLDGLLEAKRASKRSWPQLQKYWSVLHRVVAATDIAPTAEHLHSAIKMELGYTTLVKLFDGSVVEWPDSAALDAMTQSEFNLFYESAMAVLANVVGFDPREAISEAA